MIKNGNSYLPLPWPSTICQPEKKHKGSANRKRESDWTAVQGMTVNNAYPQK